MFQYFMNKHNYIHLLPFYFEIPFKNRNTAFFKVRPFIYLFYLHFLNLKLICLLLIQQLLHIKCMAFVSFTSLEFHLIIFVFFHIFGKMFVAEDMVCFMYSENIVCFFRGKVKFNWGAWLYLGFNVYCIQWFENKMVS